MGKGAARMTAPLPPSSWKWYARRERDNVWRPCASDVQSLKCSGPAKTRLCVRIDGSDGAAHFEFEGRRVTRKTQGQREVPGVIQPPHRGKIVETDQAHDAISQGTGYDALPDIIGHVVDELIRPPKAPKRFPKDQKRPRVGCPRGT